MTIKVSQITQDAGPTGDDFVLAVDNASGNSKKVAMTDLVKAGLPTQSSQSGKFLTTDGTNASWGTPAGGVGSSVTKGFVAAMAVVLG